MKVFAFCASNSIKSINKILLQECVKSLNESEYTLRTMRDFNMPIFSQDLEGDSEHEYPSDALLFLDFIRSSDAIIMSTPEHNSSMPAAFKNLIDWCSRSPQLGKNKIFDNKPLCLLSTSPGPRGGSSNLKHLESVMPWWGADIRASMSVPSFYEHYNNKSNVFNNETTKGVQKLIKGFLSDLI